MCTQRILDAETGLSFSCRKCDQCRLQGVNDIKGRLIAEQKMNERRGWPGYFVTLTYGSDDAYYGDHQRNPRAQHFFWEDVQQWRKRLWNAGYPHRCYVVGEVGDDRGRVHWHLAIWFTEWLMLPKPACQAVAVPPNIILTRPGSARLGLRSDVKRYIHWLEVPPGVDVWKKLDRDWRDTSGGLPLWTHGWSVWEELSIETIGYTVSYLFKKGRVGDTGIDGRGYAGRKYYGGTVRPPLGSDYFRDIEARKYVEAGLAPRKPIYCFDDVRKKNGAPYEFFLPPGATRREFLDAFMLTWWKVHGNDRWPYSEMLDAHAEGFMRRQDRASGKPAVDDGVANDEFQRRRFGKREGQRAPRVSNDERDRHYLIRLLQDQGFNIDVPDSIARKLGPGWNQVTEAGKKSERIKRFG